MKKALILGINGQDGSYLAEHLITLGYEIHGMVRHDINSDSRYHLHMGDLSDGRSIKQLIESIAPDEIYNLAAMSNDRHSFLMPEYTFNVDGFAVLRLLETLQRSRPQAKFFQASSSELFGRTRVSPQNEDTPFYPRSPYGVAKIYAHWSVINYREAYQLFACNGILFNHESPRRKETFVTRKIIQQVLRIKKGIQKALVLGNLEMKRDWGYAKDYVEGIHLILQQEVAEDYVLATGRLTTIRQFVEMAFQAVDIPIKWIGEGLEEQGIHSNTGQICVVISPEFFKPTESVPLCGDASKARIKLGWIPKTSIEQLIDIMIAEEEQKTLT